LLIGVGEELRRQRHRARLVVLPCGHGVGEAADVADHGEFAGVEQAGELWRGGMEAHGGQCGAVVALEGARAGGQLDGMKVRPRQGQHAAAGLVVGAQFVGPRDHRRE
jgi:hypothetical protein